MKYRRKPIEVVAVQYTGTKENWIELEKFCPYGLTERRHSFDGRKKKYLEIDTFESIMRADINDWVLMDVDGEYYTCNPTMFEKNYEPVEEGEC